MKQEKYDEISPSPMQSYPKYSKLTVFTTSGVGSGITYTFQDVVLITNNESVLSFRYQAMSDGKTKLATFYRSNLAGYSVTL